MPPPPRLSASGKDGPERVSGNRGQAISRIRGKFYCAAHKAILLCAAHGYFQVPAFDPYCRLTNCVTGPEAGHGAKQRKPLALPEDASVLILNGPNLNMLGVREPAIYGAQTLDDLEAMCLERAEALGLVIDFRQSNSEGELVGWIQQARTDNDGIIINAGAYTHTSIAILDALTLADLPVIEVHLSNIFRRESFRHHSYVSMAAKGVICGLGVNGYLLALDAMASILDRV